MALPFARSLWLCRWGAKQLGVAAVEARRGISFKLEEKTAHSSLALFKGDTGVKYGMVGLEPTKVALNVERFREWAVVLADTAVTSGRHYWEVTVKRSQQFRIGVADVDMSRDSCIGVDDRSWVFTYAQHKWHTMLAKEKAPVEGIGQPEKGEEEETWGKTWDGSERAKPLGCTLKKPTVSMDSPTAGVHRGTSLYSCLPREWGVLTLTQSAGLRHGPH
ncbi:SPRY domain-containing protein 4 isoform X1 [Diceros bicornis minor]|uniref:SPRY domain-containing protein 4 isoform X1 n=1 Tax=Diceros bicornis minor TaxID=77932 RepID=UPI0026EB81D5|nr:SPRY domain-containing protein 4 isoform X1 [Diceros bicornis minor]